MYQADSRERLKCHKECQHPHQGDVQKIARRESFRRVGFEVPGHQRLDPLIIQLLWLLILAIPIASIAWSITHEEIFREPREYCKDQSQISSKIWRRKFFYLFTCEYCF